MEHKMFKTILQFKNNGKSNRTKSIKDDSEAKRLNKSILTFDEFSSSQIFFYFILHNFSVEFLFEKKKMNTLRTTQRIFVWLSMCSAEKSASIGKRIACYTIALTIFAINFLNTISGYMYFIKFKSTDLKGCLFAFMASSATLVVLYTMINAFRLRHKTNELFKDLSIICRNDSK